MKDKATLVKETAALGTELSEMTVDRINELAPAPDLKELKLTAKQKAADEGVRYIEPKRQFKGLGTLPAKMKKDHAKAWEYVKGIYENYVVSGESIEFWYNGDFPGDPDCLWEIPANTPVYLPRFVAKHLEECQKYHTFSQLPGNVDPSPMSSREVEAMRWFRPSGTHYRGKFRGIGVFS